MPELERLARLTHETTGIGILDGDSLLTVAQVDGPNLIAVGDWTGRATPLHCVASGKVCMSVAGRARGAADRPPRARPATRSGRSSSWSHCSRSWPASAGAATRRRSASTSWGSTRSRRPIHDARGNVIAAVDIWGPAFRLTPRRIPELAAQAREAAAAISVRLGGTAPEPRARPGPRDRLTRPTHPRLGRPPQGSPDSLGCEPCPTSTESPWSDIAASSARRSLPGPPHRRRGARRAAARQPVRARHRQDPARPRGHRGHRPGAERGRAQEADGHARRPGRARHPVLHRGHRRADDPRAARARHRAGASPASASSASLSASVRRRLVRDYLNGALILLENQFAKGDVVRLAGIDGTVEDFNLRRTTVRDLDGVVHTVPNGEIKVASNLTRVWARINQDITVAYGTDIDKAIEVVDERRSARSPPDPSGSGGSSRRRGSSAIEALGEYGVTIKILGSVRAPEQWAAGGEFRKRLLAALEANGIEIPRPQRVDPLARPVRPRGRRPDRRRGRGWTRRRTTPRSTPTDDPADGSASHGCARATRYDGPASRSLGKGAFREHRPVPDADARDRESPRSKSGRSRPTRRSPRRPTRRPTCTPRPRPTRRRSGRGWRASASTGSRTSTRPSSGTCRSPSGSSAASSTSPTTASTATSSAASATRSPTTGSASPATPGRSPTPTSSARSARPPTRCSSSASRPATASRSTCR